MLVLQKTYSGFHGASRPLVRVSDQRNGLRIDGTKEEAFRQLKNALTSAPILGFPREEGLWYLDTDASDDGSGAFPGSGRGGTCHCLRQQVVGGERAEVLHGLQGAIGSGQGIETLQMLSLRAEDHGQDG